MSAAKFGVTLDQVVNDERKEPLSRHEYRVFLEYRFCAENLDFLVAVADWQKGILDLDAHVALVLKGGQEEDDPVAKAMKELPADAPKAFREAKWICAQYVTEGSPEQVNISAAYRQRLLASVEAIKDDSRDPEVFAESYKEIRNLLIRDAWEPWVEEQTSRNINAGEVKNRYIVSAVAITISISMWLALWLADDDLSPFYRLFTLVPNFVFAAYLWSAQTGVCSGLAAKNTRMHRDKTKNQGWLAAYLNRQTDDGNYCSLQQQDDAITAHIQNISGLNRIRTLALTFALTALFVVAHNW